MLHSVVNYGALGSIVVKILFRKFLYPLNKSMNSLSDCGQDLQNDGEKLPNGKTVFDFEKFYDSIKKCILENVTDEDDIDLESYLLAYIQLYNLFILLGSAFHFLASDVISKIKILQSYQKNEEGQLKSSRKFLTVKTMVSYEEENKLLNNTKYVSGCRTLLRLHRGLDFVRKFLRQVYSVENNVKLGCTAKEVYDETLAEYHSWIVKKAARLAMQFLPTRGELLKQISESEKEKLECIMELFPDAIETMNIVYDRVQHIYTVNKLLDLP